MQIIQSRRHFLASALAGAAGLLGARESFADDGPPELRRPYGESQFMRQICGSTVVVGLIAALAIAPAEARTTSFELQSIGPFAGGMEFGETGSYVRIEGIARGTLDPNDPQNAVIVNINKAPRNAEGLVEYDMDVSILRPAEATRGNRHILYDVTNRGRKFLLHWVNDAPSTSPAAINDPMTTADAGSGFVFREGYTVVWSGWDAGAPSGPDLMAIRAPIATKDGAPIVKTIRDEFVFGTRGKPDQELAKLSYEAADLDQARAKLTVRDRQEAKSTEIPIDRWVYSDSRTIRLLPEGTSFANGKIYDFWYPAKDPKVLGIGYAAIRDLISFLRYEGQDDQGRVNPIALSSSATGIEASLAVGVSQSGRALRHFQELGMNRDEVDRKVFDGLLAHISGAGKVFANHEFGHSFRTATRHEDYAFPETWFPFTYAELEDPLTGHKSSLLHGDGFDPLIIETNTSTEYWQKSASLLHTDPVGRRDIELPERVRAYLIAGTQHGGRVGLDNSTGPCVNPRNPHNPAPVLRALLVALDQWVSKGSAPPPSQVPTLMDGTLVSIEELKLPSLPGIATPRYVTRYGVPGDWINPVIDQGETYAALVPQVDPDGNEVAGVRLPPIVVPLGTYTGWNVYSETLAPGELCDRDGSFIAFAATRAERDGNGDRRPSLKERYASQEDYVAKVSAAATALVKQRLLLPEDAARYVDAAARNEMLK
jgi:hypothetical protein